MSSVAVVVLKIVPYEFGVWLVIFPVPEFNATDVDVVVLPTVIALAPAPVPIFIAKPPVPVNKLAVPT